MKKQTSEQKWGRHKEQEEVRWNSPINRTTNGLQDQLLDRPHGPTQSGIDSAKKREKLRRFEH
jgi:hypothetical protein